MKSILVAIVIVLAAVPASAGTSVRSSLITIPQLCDTSYVCNAGTCFGGGATCTTNADCGRCAFHPATACNMDTGCSVGGLSPKSKFQISGDGRFKATFSGVTDSNGALVTTDGIVGSDDDYMMFINLAGAIYSFPMVKLDFKNGKGKVTGDLSFVITGDKAITLGYAILFTPPVNPASCPGTNSAADLEARLNDADCGSGLPFAMMGLVPGL